MNFGVDVEAENAWWVASPCEWPLSPALIIVCQALSGYEGLFIPALNGR